MVLRKLIEDLPRRLTSINSFSDSLEFRLILTQVRRGDSEQAVQRNIHHFIKKQFLGEGRGTRPKITMGLRQHLGPYPRLRPLEAPLGPPRWTVQI